MLFALGHHSPEELKKEVSELDGRAGMVAWLEGDGKYQESIENISFNFIKGISKFDGRGKK